MKNIFQNLGKTPCGLPPSQIHTPNIYEQRLAETKSKGDYEQSIKALSPITYQEANKLNYQFASWFALLYHFISALLGLATVCMLAYLFSGLGSLGKYPEWLIYGMFGLVFLIFSALLIGIEVFKSSLAKGIFKKSVIGEKVAGKSLIGLGLVILFSILVSAVGGAVISYEMNDNSKQISRIYSVQSDSLRKLNDENLQAVNANIEAYKANLNKGSYWAKYATREKLDKAIETRNQLLQAANSQISTIQTAKEKEISLNTDEGMKYGLTSAIIVLFLEILSILAYWFQYAYHANCEKEAVNFEILKVNNNQLPINNVTHSDYLKEVRDLLQSVIQGNQGLQLVGNNINPNAQKVGFTFGINPINANTKEAEVSNNVSNQTYVSNNASKKFEPKKVGTLCNCENCGTPYKVKTIWQRFCKEECRLEWHGKENGFNLSLYHKKKGGKHE